MNRNQILLKMTRIINPFVLKLICNRTEHQFFLTLSVNKLKKNHLMFSLQNNFFYDIIFFSFFLQNASTLKEIYLSMLSN